MTKPILLNLEPTGYSELAVRELKKYFDYREFDDNGEVSKQLEEAYGIITRLGFNLDKKFLSQSKKLAFVATATTGVNHIDVGYVSHTCNGAVISLRGENEFLNRITPTAEHTWGLLLALIRNYKAAFRDVEKHNWQRDNFLGTQLFGKTLGIVGLGRLGKMVARYGHAFGMRVLFCDAVKIESNYKQVSLQNLLTEADVISVHAPLNALTIDLLSYREFELIKPTSVLVNTARGELVNSNALLQALKSNKIAGAALDVMSEEVAWKGKIPENNSLIDYASKNKNLIITPHIGGACPDAMRATEEFIANKIIRYWSSNR